MNRVITPNATITAGQPVIADNGQGTLPFMEDGYQEAMSSIIQGLLGSYNTNDLIILYGVVITLSTTSTTNDTANWTAGAIYYNGEIYTVPASTGGGVVKGVGEVFLYQTSISYASFDPVIFKDNVARSCHQIRQITIGHGSTGSGLADYGSSTVHYYGQVIPTALTLINSYITLGPPYSAPRYYKDRFGNVELAGYVSTGPSASGITFANLPVGYRPTTERIFPVAYSGTTIPLAVSVQATGGLLIYDISTGAQPGSFKPFDLSSIRFNVNL